MAYEELANYFNSTGVPSLGPNAKDIAKFIVLNADTKRSSVPQKSTGGPSLMSRIFDVLSRPNYAVANSIKALGEGDANFLDDFVSGLAGTQKTTFKDVFEEANIGTPTSRAALGLVLDIGLDPTTYIPGAAIARGISKVKGATKAGKAEAAAKDMLSLKPRQDVEIPTGEAPQAFRPELPSALPVDTAAKVSTSKALLENMPEGQLQLDIPGAPTRAPYKYIPPVEDAVKSPVGQLALNFPKFKVTDIRKSAAQTIEDLPTDVASVMPVPKPTPSAKHISLAQDMISSFRPKGTVLSKGQQVNLYNKAVLQVKKAFKKPGKARLQDQSFRVYLAAEQLLERQGFKTHDGVRLSDVIAKTGPEAVSQFSGLLKEGSPVWQAVQDLKASTAIQDAGVVQTVAEKTGQTKQALEAGNQLSDVQLRRVQGMLKSIAKETVKAGGVTPMAEEASTKLVKMALQGGMTPAQLAVEQSRHILNDIVATGKANPKANKALTLGLEKDMGNLPSWAVNNNKAMEFLMGRVATSWGQKDLRPLSLNQIASSINTAAARGQALDHMFTGYNQAQRAEAFRLAQGIPGVPSSPEIHVLGQQVARMMENLVGRVAGTSVITRSGVDMQMLNKWMKQYKVGFQFEKAKIKNYVTGEVHDLTKGTNWLNTWKHVELPGDCKSCVFKLQQAMEQATREKALFDEIGERFGSIVPGKGFKTKIEGHPYLDGYYFTEAIAKQIPRVVRDWTTPGFQALSGALGLYGRVLSMWKAGVTIYRPGHHVRNMVGDVYLGWMDGVNSVRPYKLAAQVQRSMGGLYKDLMNVDKLVELGVLGKDMRTPMPGRVLFTNKSGVEFTAEQIGAVAHQKGLLEHARTIEDIIDLGGGSSALDVKPFGGRVQKVARGASELQSHNARLAHFIDKVSKSRGSDLEAIFEDASRRARKWHPTGLDMTPFEKKVMRQIMPFYSWIRKSTPLLLEGLVMNPGKTVIPSKVYGAIQAAQGIDTPGRQDPFPVDQMFPSWLRQEGVGPIGLPGEGLLAKFSNQQPEGYTMAGMGLNPLTQMIAQFTDPGRTITTSLTPAIQVPLELATGKKLFTGEPIFGPESRPGSFKQYVGEQLPVLGSLQNILGITPFGSDTKAVSKSGGESRVEALTNWLTGLGIRGTGPYRSQGRYEAIAPGRMAKKINREKFLADLRSRLDGNY